MAAFGGSYLNHQFLISARTRNTSTPPRPRPRRKSPCWPTDPPATNWRWTPIPGLGAGRPAQIRQQRRHHPGQLRGQHHGPALPAQLRAAGGRRRQALRRPARPQHPAAAKLPHHRRPPVREAHRLGLVRRQLAGGAGRQGRRRRAQLQYHHQPFNYFRQFAPGSAARERHLLDGGLGDSPISNRFIADAVAGKLPAVAFYKPQGNLNMHAGYSDVESGDRHAANVLQHLMSGPQWKHMLVVITHDENGGWWDHAAPPPGTAGGRVRGFRRSSPRRSPSAGMWITPFTTPRPSSVSSAGCMICRSWKG